MTFDRTTCSVSPGSHINLLIRSLNPGDLRLLAPHLERISISGGETVISPDTPLTRMLFPETLLVGFREASGVGLSTQIGMVGREGLVGWPLLLGTDQSALLGFAQLHDGTALAIDAKKLKAACRVSETLKDSLLRYVHNFMAQLANTIVSNASDPIERRMARWLLMLHDRIDEDAFSVTHDHISSALSVRRASVTDCLHIMEGEGLLRCMRGRLAIRDRERLKQLAGTSYGSVEAHYARHIGPPVRMVQADHG
ncbi:MAG: Crp/Fnr family transcriptional regulator [Sphingomonadales bacterium]|nr:MAG: Crp/Fnr family transcriptional regulator [Sphingomonadales bacterium]